ncbi:MAG: hypothetical protein ABIR56_08710 [Polaromonas sp.]
MATKQTGSSNPRSEFILEGNITFQESQGEHQDLGVKVFAFDRLGVSLGGGELDAKGNFRMALRLGAPADIQVMAGPGTDAMSVRQSSAYLQTFTAKDWKKEGASYVINPKLVIPQLIWWPWRPVRICVSGHVRKIDKHEGHTQICPVPFVKVEIFDVDREACWWPPIRNWWDTLLDRPVIRIPDLLKPRPFPPRPFPGPDPAPELRLDPRVTGAAGGFSPGAEVSLNPQPLPPRMSSARMAVNATESRNFTAQTDLAQLPDVSRVGEARLMDAAIASRLDRLTLTSKIPPWAIFPRCFYSKQLVCETYTDCDGYFRCCFRWSPIHFRHGRLRFDGRPDIIVRVTQIINGVSTVIYMDPYTSTRWDVTHAHLDLYLDNEEVRCGRGCHPPPEGSPVFFTRIGNDEVYQISQGSGLYADASYSKMAYGGNLLVFALFGDALASGAPKRYYRLSYAKQGSADADFKFIDADLRDTRVDKLTLTSSDHFLGPQPVNGSTTLYEVRNRNAYYWYNPDWIGSWWTPPVEEDTATYVLRLELFDENGVYLNTASGLVDYRDGTVTPPALLPAMTDHCDLVVTLDNKPAVVNLDIPAVLNECGVIPWSPALTLTFNVSATQENNRLHSWTLQYTKGVNPAVNVLGSNSSSSGALSPVSLPVSGAPLLAGLTSTCAFALKLYGWAHIRNGYGFVYYTEQIKAIAIEKCAPCPECQGNVIF